MNEITDITCALQVIYMLPNSLQLGRKRLYDFRFQCGKEIARKLPQSVRVHADSVVSVPRSGDSYAEGVASELGLPVVHVLTKRSVDKRSFFINEQHDRKQMIADDLVLCVPNSSCREVVLVDESIFTGDTLRHAINLLRSTGIEKVHVCLPAPPCYRQCPYGRQPARQQLMEKMDRSEMLGYLQADSLIWQSWTTFHNLFMSFISSHIICMDSIGVCDFCGECFTSNVE